MPLKRDISLFFHPLHDTYLTIKIFGMNQATMHNDIFNLLNESIWLLVIGMAVVFSFLTVLIGAVKLIQRFCEAFPGVEEAQPSPVSQRVVGSTASGVSPQVVAAVTAAIHQHRQSR